jgi:hypothetical protein
VLRQTTFEINLDARRFVRQAGAMAWFVEEHEGTPTPGGTPSDGEAAQPAPDILRKPGILEDLERWFNPSDPERRRARYDEAIASLDSLDHHDWMEPAAGTGVDAEDVTHFENHWLGYGNGFWSGVDANEVVEKFRTGFKAAMSAAREADLPLNYVWVAPDALPDDYFEVSHVVGPTSVTAAIVTAKPRPPAS